MAGVARRVSSCECRQTSRRPACSPRSTRGKVSSVAARAKLTAALEFVREGDVLVVTKPDCLARSTRNLLDIVEDLEEARHRPGRAVNGRPADRHPQPDRKSRC